MQKRRLFWGIRYRMFLLNTLAGIVLLILLGGGVITATNEFVKNDYRRSATTTSRLLMAGIDSKLSEMKSTLITLSLEPDLQAFSSSLSGYERDAMRRRFLEYADNLIRTRKHLEYYLFDGRKPYAWSSISTDATIDYLHEQSAKDWLASIRSHEEDLVPIPSFHTLKSIRPISYAYGLRLQPVKFWQDAFLLVSLNHAFFTELTTTVQVPAGDLLAVTDELGNTVYLVGDATAFDMNSPTGDGGYLQVDTVSAESGWRIWYYASTAPMQREMGTFFLLVCLAILAAAFLLAAGTWFISTRVTRPIRDLSILIASAESLNYRVSAREHNKDETGVLGMRFNQMLHRLLQMQVLRREAEIQALQQQIQPHFLYNTLENINALAEIHGCEDIGRICQSLGGMLRYSLGPFGEMATLEEELQHVGHYIAIMKQRHGDRFSLSSDVPPKLLSCRLPRLTIQPLVENSLLHGMRNMLNGGNVYITAHETAGGVLIDVTDNGDGIRPDALTSLQETVQRGVELTVQGGRRGIGLENVHHRLELAFGSPYGLELIPLAKGLRVRIRIPAQYGEDEYV